MWISAQPAVEDSKCLHHRILRMNTRLRSHKLDLARAEWNEFITIDPLIPCLTQHSVGLSINNWAPKAIYQKRYQLQAGPSIREDLTRVDDYQALHGHQPPAPAVEATKAGQHPLVAIDLYVHRRPFKGAHAAIVRSIPNDARARRWKCQGGCAGPRRVLISNVTDVSFRYCWQPKPSHQATPYA